MTRRLMAAALVLLFAGAPLGAEAPVASYIFPAGGQRGKVVTVRAGGLFLHERCAFEVLGPGVEADSELRRTKSIWFEGPLIPQPESQQAEDYPRDMAGQIRIAAGAPLGVRHWRLATSQGATPSLKFIIGDLPELVEDEIDGDPVPVGVILPVTVNGRIFPREDVDVWAFRARQGESITCALNAARLGSPLDARLEVLDAQGRRLAENDDANGPDPLVHFTAPANGTYQVRIHDVQFRGGQAYVYRLTLTSGPHLDAVFPLGGQRGAKLSVEPHGWGLPPAALEIALPPDGPRTAMHQLRISGALSNPVLLDLDDLPENVEMEPNDQREQATPVAAPVIFNGRIGRAGDIDWWVVTARKAEPLIVELRAAQLGSPLRGVLVICDGAGKELARAESDGAADPSLTFATAADGPCVIRVEERFRGRGGPAYAYRLRVARPPEPNFRLYLATDALTLPRGGEAKLKVNVERVGGFNEPVTLELTGLPAGVTAANATIPAKQTAVDVVVKSSPSASIRATRLRVQGTAKIGECTVARTATLLTSPGESPVDSVLLAVALPTPFKIVGEYDMRWAARGSTHRRHYRIERGGYDGPIEVALTDRQARHLQGVTGPTITVPAGATEFDYAVFLPPWMETGRTCRVCVMGTAVLKDADGTPHVVSFSSVAQNEQVVAVIEPGRLGVEINPGSLLVQPGRSASIAVEVTRAKGLHGPVKVELELARHFRGIQAVPLSIPAESARGTLTISFAANASGPYNLPVLVRATVLETGQPVVAEAKLAVEMEPDTSREQRR